MALATEVDARALPQIGAEKLSDLKYAEIMSAAEQRAQARCRGNWMLYIARRSNSCSKSRYAYVRRGRSNNKSC